MNIANDALFLWLSQYAYQPQIVYLTVVTIMLASGFGFPIPEEVTIVSVGLIAYMGAHPQEPPPPGASVVNGYEAAIVTLLAVLFADCLVFFLGRVFGRKVMQMPRFKSFFSEDRLHKINHWVKKHGLRAVFVFRFTPGIRFPAHIILGMSKIHVWQFAAVDGLAALISVPTQILLVYKFGEYILPVLHNLKLAIFGVLVIAGIAYGLKFYNARKEKLNEQSHDGATYKKPSSF
jgi:membrane protein DedA with SNARE-associated domain